MWIKICGLTDPATAKQVAACRPNAIGLNFYSKSPRRVTVEAAREIVQLLPDDVEPIGLFVNQPLQVIEDHCQAVGLKTIQLHGDEAPEFAAQLTHFKIIRAFRVGDEGLAPVAEQLECYCRLGVELMGCIVDAKVQGAYGGTGHTAPWNLLKDWNHSDWPPLILAGGLTPENVQEAIRTVQPFGVDTASGVEDAPGRQSLDKVQRLIAQASEAFHVP